MLVNDNKSFTHDVLNRYGLRLIQPAEGYRFSLDALLLADFVKPEEQGRVVELGTGCGVISLVLCRRFPNMRMVGIEMDEAMAAIACMNAEQNGLSDNFSIVREDVLATRSLFPVSAFDGVVSNPPFRTPNSGRLSPKAGRDTARHESTAGMAEFLAAAKYLVKPSGRIWFIYHPDRLVEFIHCAREQKLAVLRLRMVHGSVNAPAKMFLAELAKGRKGTTAILPPLIVHDDKGEYTPETLQILTGSEKGA